MNKHEIKTQLSRLFETTYNETILAFNWLPESGSIRSYARISSENHSVIGTYNIHKKENEAFFSFSGTFVENNINVPAIIAISEDRICYLQTDLGNVTLQNFLYDEKIPKEEKLAMIDMALMQLVHLHTIPSNRIDYTLCFPRAKFDRQSLQWDFNYFKYNFLKVIDIAFDEQKLENDFIVLIERLLAVDSDYFMHRDFQSSNIMIADNEPWFIDFQGGRKGPLQYDLVSLLFSPRTMLNNEDRVQYLVFYLTELSKVQKVNKEQFTNDFYLFALARILQALGAYGYRGLIQNKYDFVRRIPTAIENLENLIVSGNLPIELPEIQQCINQLIAFDWSRYVTTENDNLTIRVQSFSYKRRIPFDPSGNGGGFVFDCRALPNPHRHEQLRPFNGTQQEIIDYFSTKAKMEEFLIHVKEITKISIANYQLRGFNNLSINFGCTGGKHRSVYCAERYAQWLENNFNVKVVLIHTEKDNWN